MEETKQNSNVPPIYTEPKQRGGCTMLALISLGVVLLVFVIGVVLGSGGTGKGSSLEDSDSIAVIDSVEGEQNLEKEANDSGSWKYSTKVDEMNDSKSKFASIVSDNVEFFDFPYGGGSSLTLAVRWTKKWGTDVYIAISSGQFLCSDYNATNFVRVRFGEEKPIKFYTVEPSDNSSDVLFFENAKKFITHAKKAKKIRIEAPFYQEGNHVFTFTMSEPLIW